MFKDLQGKSTLYKIWIISAAISLLYFLAKLFLYEELSLFDRTLNLYGIATIFIHHQLTGSVEKTGGSA